MNTHFILITIRAVLIHEIFVTGSKDIDLGLARFDTDVAVFVWWSEVLWAPRFLLFVLT
jgi:hypothetical protein